MTTQSPGSRRQENHCMGGITRAAIGAYDIRERDFIACCYAQRYLQWPVQPISVQVSHQILDTEADIAVVAGLPACQQMRDARLPEPLHDRLFLLPK